jgi:hypothetical protein
VKTPFKTLTFLSLTRLQKLKHALYKSCSRLARDSRRLAPVKDEDQPECSRPPRLAPEPVHTLFPAQAEFSKAISNNTIKATEHSKGSDINHFLKNIKIDNMENRVN